MSATVKVIERFFHSDGTIEGPDEFEGPRISVKVVQDGAIGGKAVKKGQTISLCERDAIREMCWNGMVEIDSFKLTRMGSILLRSRGHGYYDEPVGKLGVIPKIKVIGTEDDACVGHRILMKGEVQELPEDVVWGLLQSPVHARFTIAPGAEFTLPPETLLAMVADVTFDVNYHS